MLPIVAGVAFGCVVYYGFRVAPRIVQRVAQAEGRHAATASSFAQVRPYHAYEYGFQKTMSQREAQMVLGMPAGGLTAPAAEQVKKQYRALMMDLHSDVGGTPYLAAKLNEAKDILIR